MKIKNQNRIKKKKSPPKSLSQHKSKSKSKNTTFNPLQYLNALIELTNESNALKVKKNKVPQKRDLSSALTIATPAMQKTISTSKIRCKSSYSQYRKKSTTSNVNNLNKANNLKQVLDLKVNNYIITEEQDSSNCIKFTSMESSNNSRQQTPMAQKNDKLEIYLRQFQPKLKQVRKFSEFCDFPQEIDYNYYAKKIQRAWRSFQTYKVIHKYYRHFKKQRREEKHQAEKERKLQNAHRGNKKNQREYDNYQHEQRQEAPSVYAYLNNYYDVPLQQNSSQLVSAHEELLQRTIKFKVRNSQHSVHPPDEYDQLQKQFQYQNKAYYLKGENSESKNELNLTQKLTQIKEYIGQECRKEQNLPEMSSTPTVQIKKCTRTQSHHLPEPLNSNPKNQLNQSNQQDNSSTQKKRKFPLGIRIQKSPLQNSYTSQLKEFILNQSLDRSPTLKEDLNLSLKKGTAEKLQSDNFKGASLVDSMIKKETEKYNQILTLIEICKTDQNKKYKNGPKILTEVLKKLEQHKSELQIMEGRKHENNLNGNLKGVNEKYQNEKSFVKEGSSCGDGSFLAFESKDIYHSFEDYEFNSGEKFRIDRNNTILNRKQLNGPLVSSQRKEEIFGPCNDQCQKVNGANLVTQLLKPNQSCDFLRRFSSLLDEEEHKLTELIKSSKKMQQIQIEYIPSVDTSQSSQFYLSQKLSDQINSTSRIKRSKEQQKKFQEQSSQQEISSEQFSQSKQDDVSSMYSFCSSEWRSDAANKMFHQHLNLLKLKKQRSIKNLNKLREENKIPEESFEARVKQIEQKFHLQKKQIETKKKQYIKSLNSVKKQAIQFHKDLLSSSKKFQTLNQYHEDEEIQENKKYTSLTVRKSFSAESKVLKCILKQPMLTTKEIIQERFLIRQSQIENYDLDDESEDWSEGQNIDAEEKSVGEMLRSENEMKIDHKQNIILSKELTNNQNDLLIRSQLLERRELANSNEDLPITQIQQSKQLEKQSSQRVEQQQSTSKNGKYVECDEVWVKCSNITPIRTDEQFTSNQLSISNNNLDSVTREGESQSNLTYLEETELQHSKDELLIDSLLQENSQTSDRLDNSDFPSNDPPLSSSCALMQRCSQQLEQLIQTELINELLETIYLNDYMLALFKPFIEEIFQFAPITDSHIIDFINQDLPKYFPPFSELIQRANQKINPTSTEILRLVRDFDYEIDQYELILSEDIFKNVRKSIELEYQSKITLKNQIPINPSIYFNNQEVLQKVHKRELQKRAKVQKYLGYERDMKIMYMKAVFNCLNEFLIEQKSIATHVNTRSTIGTGELTLSIKEFNINCHKKDVEMFFTKTQERMKMLLKNKCMLPNFKNYKDVGLFQKQMLKMIKNELDQNEYKWVTYMDEVLEIWNEMANQICDNMFLEATYEMMLVKQKQPNL